MTSLDEMPILAKLHRHKWEWPVCGIGWAECECGAIARYGEVVGYRMPKKVDNSVHTKKMGEK